MRIFYDTEFLEWGPAHPIDLISIGMVREDGAEYYAISGEFDIEAVLEHDWLRANVWPYLPQIESANGGLFYRRDEAKAAPVWLDEDHPDVKPRAQLAAEVAAFVLAEPNPQLWAYYGAYDHVALCQLFGRMVDLPDGFPMWTADLKQRMRDLGVGRDELPEQDAREHHALSDARWVRDTMVYLDDCVGIVR